MRTVQGPDAKLCVRCERVLPWADFGSCSSKPHGLDSYCRECERIRTRQKYAADPAAYKKRVALDHTIRGSARSAYGYMLARVSGQVTGAPQYKGLPILPRWRFYQLTAKSDAWKRLFVAWRASGFKHNLRPTVDRIVPAKGYAESNIQFLSHFDNNRLGHEGELIAFRGKKLSVASWAREISVKPSTLYARLGRYGWSVARALGGNRENAACACNLG